MNALQTPIFSLQTRSRQLLADTHTPVSIYLKLRDRYRNTLLLESSDYHSADNSFSYICCEPLATFSLQQETIALSYPDGSREQKPVAERRQVVEALYQFSAAFAAEEPYQRFVSGGLFGYMSYEAVRYFEDLELQPGRLIPDIHYSVYRFVIVLDHFRNELYLFEHGLEGEESQGLEGLESVLQNKNLPSYGFALAGEESRTMEDAQYLEVIRRGIAHCQRGDVFQIVLSRRFQQGYKGDDFNVYRALRSINPSPYLFYFDYGSFRIFGSSPEAQLTMKGDKAHIYPIAGTFRRTGNDEADAELARKLAQDPKENAEHVMLVDLARNDLSRHGHSVQVTKLKEIQFYSHVIHLVSQVQATLEGGINPVQMVADTFPAGTLSGAPKHRAMQLIEQHEPTPRSYYGGAIGFMGFNAGREPLFNHAIMIRSFLSKDQQLYFQAGAGVVAKSKPESELQEVHNKLAALRKALQLAQTLR
ncbi:anthranilate synthase component I family protein [Cesiribacter andamanensis]|uniref:Anthranilate synthase component 1 n=1 Tax=Cesiribacter andamanensis AMV16 TaxID=1279009 RepID=M7N2Z2_9BACT|nr:anthranilate synthase component I family protein [Cesiribacter andamanensis]EMR01657.1 Anthranilate synthase component 1 [Cesiribacter andamanensis AMV16]